MNGIRSNRYRWHNVDVTHRSDQPHQDALSFELPMRKFIGQVVDFIPAALELTLTSDYFSPTLSLCIERYFGYGDEEYELLYFDEMAAIGVPTDLARNWLAGLQADVTHTLTRLGYQPEEIEIDYVDVSPSGFSVVLSWKLCP